MSTATAFSQPPLIITPATERELPQIITLAQRIWPVAYANILTPKQIDNMLDCIYSPENLRQEMQDGHRFWLATENAVPLGYASGYRENAQIVWLKKIYVEVGQQGKGIGGALIRTLISAFAPARELRLLVNPHNIPAHRYYTHQGFSKIGEVPVRMGDWNFDDFIFSRPITDH